MEPCEVFGQTVVRALYSVLPSPLGALIWQYATPTLFVPSQGEGTQPAQSIQFRFFAEPHELTAIDVLFVDATVEFHCIGRHHSFGAYCYILPYHSEEDDSEPTSIASLGGSGLFQLVEETSTQTRSRSDKTDMVFVNMHIVGMRNGITQIRLGVYRCAAPCDYLSYQWHQLLRKWGDLRQWHHLEQEWKDLLGIASSCDLWPPQQNILTV